MPKKRQTVGVASSEQQRQQQDAKAFRAMQLIDLPVEILGFICEELDEISSEDFAWEKLRYSNPTSKACSRRVRDAPRDLHALALSCKKLLPIAQYQLFRRITILPWLVSPLPALVHRSNLRSAVRHAHWVSPGWMTRPEGQILEEFIYQMGFGVRKSRRIASLKVHEEDFIPAQPWYDLFGKLYGARFLHCVMPNVQNLTVQITYLENLPAIDVLGQRKDSIFIEMQPRHTLSNLQVLTVHCTMRSEDLISSFGNDIFFLHNLLQCAPNLLYLTLLDIHGILPISLSQIESLDHAAQCLSTLNTFSIRNSYLSREQGITDYLKKWLSMCTSLQECHLDLDIFGGPGQVCLQPDMLLQFIAEAQPCLRNISLILDGAGSYVDLDSCSVSPNIFTQFCHLETLGLGLICLQNTEVDVLAGMLPSTVTKLVLFLGISDDIHIRGLLWQIRCLGKILAAGGRPYSLHNLKIILSSEIYPEDWHNDIEAIKTIFEPTKTRLQIMWN